MGFPREWHSADAPAQEMGVCIELLEAHQIRRPCGEREEPENSGSRTETERCGRGLRQANPVQRPNPISMTKGNGVRVLSNTQFPRKEQLDACAPRPSGTCVRVRVRVRARAHASAGRLESGFPFFPRVAAPRGHCRGLSSFLFTPQTECAHGKKPWACVRVEGRGSWLALAEACPSAGRTTAGGPTSRRQGSGCTGGPVLPVPLYCPSLPMCLAFPSSRTPGLQEGATSFSLTPGVLCRLLCSLNTCVRAAPYGGMMAEVRVYTSVLRLRVNQFQPAAGGQLYGTGKEHPPPPIVFASGVFRADP